MAKSEKQRAVIPAIQDAKAGGALEGAA